MKPVNICATFMCSMLLVSAGSASAHHSYANYERNERSEFTGRITQIIWNNPHIVLTITDGEQALRVEWIAAQRALREGVMKEQISEGDTITLIGCKNLLPGKHIMTLIKEVSIPEKNLNWISRSLVTTKISTR